MIFDKWKLIKFTRKCLFIFPVASLFVVTCAGFSFSQGKTLSARYQPVVIPGSVFTDSLKITDWKLFAFDMTGGKWQAIPFQMDEIDHKGNFLEENDGFLGANDQLLFMPNDAGDQAGPDLWPNGIESSERFEIEIVDPVDPQSKGWAYLLKSKTMVPEPPAYFHYLPDSQSAYSDTIETRSYKLGHNRKGWTDFVSLSSNREKDLIDRIKFHINGGGTYVPPIFLTEDTLNFKTEEFVVRPIRSFQKVKTKLFLHIPPLPPLDKQDSFILAYYPYSTEISAGFTIDSSSRYLLVLLQIKNIRLSIDFNPGIQDLYFFGSLNRNGFKIDGSPDSPTIFLPDAEAPHWVMASGVDGTIVTLFDIPTVTGATGKTLYYRDDLHGGTNEQTPDTGDQVSIGDMGVWLSGGALVPESDSLFLSFTTYYIDEANKNADFGDKIANDINHPLQVQVIRQSKSTDVNGRSRMPASFHLLNVCPNPFSPGPGNLTFRVDLQNEFQKGELLIFNLLGRIVDRVNLDEFSGHARTRSFRWSGRDKNGFPLRAGVYFYQVKIDGNSQTKKLIVM